MEGFLRDEEDCCFLSYFLVNFHGMGGEESLSSLHRHIWAQVTQVPMPGHSDPTNCVHSCSNHPNQPRAGSLMPLTHPKQPFSHSASLSFLGLSSGMPRAALSSSRRAQKGQQGQQEMPGVSPRGWVVPQPTPGPPGGGGRALEVPTLAGFPSSLTSSAVIRAWLSPAIKLPSLAPSLNMGSSRLCLFNIQMNSNPRHTNSS